MAKKRESTLKNWDEADQAMKSLAEKMIQVEQFEGQMTVNINSIKDTYEKTVNPLNAEIKFLEDDIRLFAEANKAEFVKDRTKKLNFGTISFRISESLSVKNIKATLAGLKNLNLLSYIRVKEEPDKEAMKGLDDATLLKIGVERKKIDKVTIEPTFEQIAQVATQK